MININEKPYFQNETTKWHKDEEVTDFATQKQSDNTLSLGTVMCFAVIGKDISDYVLIDNRQNIYLGLIFCSDFGRKNKRINKTLWKLKSC